jgi:hypothetical protein
VIFANSAPAVLAAKRATTTIQIVFETLGDLMSVGLASSVARPGYRRPDGDGGAPRGTPVASAGLSESTVRRPGSSASSWLP